MSEDDVDAAVLQGHIDCITADANGHSRLSGYCIVSRSSLRVILAAVGRLRQERDEATKAKDSPPQHSLADKIVDACMDRYKYTSGTWRDCLRTCILDIAAETGPLLRGAEPAQEDVYCVISASVVRRTFLRTMEEAAAHAEKLIDRSSKACEKFLIVKVEQITECAAPPVKTRPLNPGELLPLASAPEPDAVEDALRARQ